MGSMAELRAQAGGTQDRLQEIFLSLTGGADVQEALAMFRL